MAGRIKGYIAMLLIIALVMPACSLNDKNDKNDKKTTPPPAAVKVKKPPPPAMIIQSVKILALKAFPTRINVAVTARLSVCKHISDITQIRNGGVFAIKFIVAGNNVLYKNAAACRRNTLESFMIPLDVYGLRSGLYTVGVNGMSDSFELEVDNIIR
ncbi:MAG: hypothetical protein GY862_38415 [Gammaproteobacteria bacterium]|nr:hypothetical protein [Gammaproteobacteria bacterium]